MRVMIFLMDNTDSLVMTRPLLETLRAAGAQATLVHYWSTDLFPIEDLLAYRPNYLTLSDGGLGTIPRVSRAQYLELCGDDIDFHGCQYHNLAVRGFPPTREFLYEDSMYHQWFYGLAYRAESLLRTVDPDVVIVNHGSETISKLLYAKSRHLGYPTLLSESSFVPGKFLIDSVGMHFFPGQHRIERDWPGVRETPLDPSQRDALARYLETWRSQGTSKYAQAESRPEVEQLGRFLGSGRKTLFVVDQLAWDANILNGHRAYASFPAMVESVRERCPADWQIVYKLHPRNPDAEGVAVGPNGPRELIVRDISIHRLLRDCDAVLTYSSNVGMEALAYGRPVIVAGRPHYADRGLTLDLEVPEALPERLQQARSFRPEAQVRDRYLHHVLFDYLIDTGDTTRLLARFEEAGGGEPERCPFSSHYPPWFGAYRKAATSYNELASQNYSHDEILAAIGRIPPPPRAEVLVRSDAHEDWARLESGERQVAYDWCGVAENHRVRYGLARELVRPGQRILDISCGTGYGTFLLTSGTGATGVGVDCSEEAIEFARDFFHAPGAEYVHASAGSFPLGEREFDLIVSFETVEHLADDRRFLARLWRALRPGGQLLVSVPNLERYPMQAHQFHVRHYSPESLAALLARLPDVAWTRLLGQVEDRRITERADGKHLLGIVAKSAGVDAPILGPEVIDRALPCTTVEFEEARQSRWRFRPCRFQVPGGESTGRSVAIELASSQGCAVFGPYARLRPGSYAAGFLVGLSSTGERFEGRLVLDIVTHTGRIYEAIELSGRVLDELHDERRLIVAPFRHDRYEEAIEFRVRVEGGPMKATLTFEGVEVRDMSMAGCRPDESWPEAAGSDSRDPGDPFESGVVLLDLARQERERAEAARQVLEQERGEFDRQRIAWKATLDHYEKTLEQWRRERDHLAASHHHLERQLVETQEQLRPYRLIDRLGVVRSSYRWARGLKRRLVS